MPPSPQPSATSRDGRSSPTVSVVIPAVDQAAVLPHVLRALPPVDEVIVVDRGPAGDTAAAARAARPGTHVVRQTRSGTGNALACGIAACRSDIVVMLNADGTTDPSEIPRFVDALRAGADVAHGSRFRPGGGDLTGGRAERAAAAVLSRVVNAFLGTRCTDPTWGYNAYRREALHVLDLPGPDVPGLRRGRRAWGDGPEIAPLSIVRAAVEGLRVVEVASVGHPRMHGDARRDLFHRVLLAVRVLLTELLLRRRPRSAAAPRARRSAPTSRSAVTGSRRAASPSPATTAARRAAASPTGSAARFPISAARRPAPGAPVPASPAASPAAGTSPWTDEARPGGRHATVAVPVPRQEPLPSGPPGERALPAPPAPPADPPVPVEPSLSSGTPSGRDAAREPADRRRGHPGRRPAWATREPGVHRTVDVTGGHRGNVDDTGVHHLPEGDRGGRRAEGRRSGLYDTGVHRVGVYQSGVHRTDVYDAGAPDLPAEEGPMYRRSAPRDVGGGRRRLGTEERGPDLTVVPREGADGDRGRARHHRRDDDHGRLRQRGRDDEHGRTRRHRRDDEQGRGHGWEPGRDHARSGDGEPPYPRPGPRAARPAHLRAVPGERFPR